MGGIGIGIGLSLPRGVLLAGGGAAVAAAWWLAGGISAANAIGVYQAKGAESLAASYVNLANPGTYDLTLGTAPVWDAANGWTFNGDTNSRHLNTGIVPAPGWSMIARFSDVTTASASVAGSRGSGSSRFLLSPNYGGWRTYGYGNSAQPGAGLAAGTLAIAANACYANGVPDGTIIVTPTFTLPISIGGRNSATGTVEFINGKIQALAIYNATLDAEMVAAVHDAMLAL